MKTPEYEILSRNVRNGLVEELHFGVFLKFQNGKVVKSFGKDNNYPFFQRSCMKPLQFAAISEVVDSFDFSPQEIAVSMASHSGEDFHIETILGILKKIGLDESYLLCPPQEPLNLEAKNSLIKNSQPYRAIHNNCSGKHAAMLAYCVLKGYDVKNYNEVNHPLQKHVLNFVSNLCGVSLSKCQISRDGCTLPVVATPLKNLAQGFLEVFTNEKFDKLKQAALQYPYYFGGHGRTDSEIASSSKNLIAKVGAGNLCCVVDLAEKACYVIKVADGDNFARGVILTEFLKKSKKINSAKLEKLFPTKITDETGVEVGKIEVFCTDFE